MKSHKLFDIVLFSLTVVLFVIGVHQTVVYDIGKSYWLFMLCFGTLALYNIRRMNRENRERKAEKRAKLPKKKGKNSGKR